MRPPEGRTVNELPFHANGVACTQRSRLLGMCKAGATVTNAGRGRCRTLAGRAAQGLEPAPGKSRRLEVRATPASENSCTWKGLTSCPSMRRLATWVATAATARNKGVRATWRMRC
jgi:hypothetical protein